MSVFMQFDGDIDDETKKSQLIVELKQAGVKAKDIHVSRWRDLDGNDIGGRIDVELEDDMGTKDERRQKNINVEIAMNASNKWNKKPT